MDDRKQPTKWLLAVTSCTKPLQDDSVMHIDVSVKMAAKAHYNFKSEPKRAAAFKRTKSSEMI